MYTRQDLERLDYDELCELMANNQRYFHARELVIKLLDIGNMMGRGEIELGSLWIEIPRGYGVLSVLYSDTLVLEVTLVSDYDDREDYAYVPNFDMPFVSLLNEDVVAQIDQLHSELLLDKQRRIEQEVNANKRRLIDKIFREKSENA